MKIPSPSLELSKPGKRGKGNSFGTEWHNEVGTIINERKEKKLFFEQGPEEFQVPTERPELRLLEVIFNELNVNCLESEFQLYGYMYPKKGDAVKPKVDLWDGKADAIGWYQDAKSGEGRYVIVEWKTLPDIATFWSKNRDAYGSYLHQALVYARLFQLQMSLDYLPYILIVPISSTTGKDFHPALFFDYPEKCKEKIESFEWSIEKPDPPLQIPSKEPFNKEKLKKGEIVDKKMLLADFFSKGATVEDLMKVFKWPSLQVM